MTSRIFLKLEGMSADHANTPEFGGFHAQLRALDVMESCRYRILKFVVYWNSSCLRRNDNNSAKWVPCIAKIEAYILTFESRG